MRPRGSRAPQVGWLLSPRDPGDGLRDCSSTTISSAGRVPSRSRLADDDVAGGDPEGRCCGGVGDHQHQAGVGAPGSACSGVEKYSIPA